MVQCTSEIGTNVRGLPESSVKRRRLATNDSAPARYDPGGHFPNFDGKKSKSRCKMHGCTHFTHVYCLRCDVHLCFVKGRNCFYEFHQNDPSV